MDATQHCAIAKDHSENAANNVSLATTNMGEIIDQLNAVITSLNEVQSHIHGVRVDEIDAAASHMQEVHDIVGSSTAEQLASRYRHVGEMIENDPISGLKSAVDIVQNAITACTGVSNSLFVDATELNQLKDEVNDLAAQLGA